MLKNIVPTISLILIAATLCSHYGAAAVGTAECPTGTYLNDTAANVPLCIPCRYPCTACSDGNTCTACDQSQVPLYLTPNGLCSVTCPDGYWAPNGITCDAPCLQACPGKCFPATGVCVSCRPGFDPQYYCQFLNQLAASLSGLPLYEYLSTSGP